MKKKAEERWYPISAFRFSLFKWFLFFDHIGHHRHHLRRAGRNDATGHEEAGGVLIGKPHGLRHDRHVRAEPEWIERQHPATDQSRNLDRRALLDRGHHLRTATHARDRAIWRALLSDAGLCGRISDHDDVVDRIAAAQRIYG